MPILLVIVCFAGSKKEEIEFISYDFNLQRNTNLEEVGNDKVIKIEWERE